MRKSSPLIYAIDFGTSNSLLAAANQETIIPPIPLDAQAPDPTVLRSLLYFPNMDHCFYGLSAIEQYIQNQASGRLIRSIKKFLPMRSFIGTWIENRPANLEDIIGFFLREMRTRANAHFDCEIDAVVLGRPAKFSADELDDKFAESRLEQAAKRAGFKEIYFCPEPVAAAFDFRAKLRESKTILVGDFGGGTSDFTIIRFHPGPHRPEDVLSIGGVSLAGDALDGAIMRNKLAPYFGSDVTYKVPFGSNVIKMPTNLMEKICSPAEVALLGQRDIKDFLQQVKRGALGPKDKEKIDRLFCLIENQLGFSVFESIERAKRNLSDAEETVINYDYPTVEIKEPILRKEFQEYTQGVVQKIMASLDETLQKAGLKSQDIDLVYCVPRRPTPHFHSF